MRLLLALILLATLAVADDRVTLSPDGVFRTTAGDRFLPLGGFHGNLIASEANLDLSDASDEQLDHWFQTLAADGVSAVRLFARAHISYDVLDLCGKLNPDLQQTFHRAFAAARPYGIRFQLQILPEPVGMCYFQPDSVAKFAVPRYSQQELANLTPAQRRFIVDGKRVPIREIFTDADVRTCQRLYLGQALAWVAREPQIFALEIYNEQGSNGAIVDGRWQNFFTFPFEAEEIRWTRRIVDLIHSRLPGMPVTISHAGYGVTVFDPLRWAKDTGVDFYSSHMYAGSTGDYEKADFAAATVATSLIIRAGIPTFSGEWGMFQSEAPPAVKRYVHRDAIWLSLLAGLPGFFQWTYEFPEEYRAPAKIFASLPRDFAPERPRTVVDIGAAYRSFQDNSRYPLFLAGQLFPPLPFQRQKQQDANLRRIFAAYTHALSIGVPIAFSLGEPGSISLEKFAALDPATLKLPIECQGSYQMTWLKDARNPLWLAYLRSRRVVQFGNQFAGVPVAGNLDLRFHLTKDRYRGRVIDLNTGWDDPLDVSDMETFTISNTRDDYVIIIAPEGLKRRE